MVVMTVAIQRVRAGEKVKNEMWIRLKEGFRKLIPKVGYNIIEINRL